MSYDEYAALPAVRSSHLKGIERSPAHMRANMLDQTETSAMVVGRALHVALLEPRMFSRQYVGAPKLDRRTNAGRAEWAAFQELHAGKTVLTADEISECMALSRAAHGHPDAALLCDALGYNEATIVWKEEALGLYGKCRLDRLTTVDGYSTIVDFKTARDASPLRFAAQAANLGYHMQAAWYLRGADAISPVARRFVFVVLEKEEPHAVACYELDQEFLAEGQRLVEKALIAYKNATESGVWPGYRRGIHTLFAPAWMRASSTNEGDFTDV
jgi:hypothetical protein